MADRPRAGEPPALDSTLEVLRELLAVERARLQVARRIEDERRMVFPETTVIIRDIERLLTEIASREAPDPAPSTVRPSGLGSAELEPWE